VGVQFLSARPARPLKRPQRLEPPALLAETLDVAVHHQLRGLHVLRAHAEAAVVGALAVQGAGAAVDLCGGMEKKER
jgi:hypothetical protein